MGLTWIKNSDNWDLVDENKNTYAILQRIGKQLYFLIDLTSEEIVLKRENYYMEDEYCGMLDILNQARRKIEQKEAKEW